MEEKNYEEFLKVVCTASLYGNSPTSKDFTYTRVLFNLFRNVMNYRNFEFFFLFLSLKTLKNSSRQMRQLYAYVSIESTRQSVEDGMSTGLTNTHTALGSSVLYNMFARKKCILCSALLHKSYLTLPYVTSLRDLFCLGTFAHSFIACRLAATRLCEASLWQKHGGKRHDN